MTQHIKQFIIKRYHPVFRLIIFSVICTTLFPLKLHSQDFEVAPASLKFRVLPGESEVKTVTVKNHGNQKETITIQIQDFLVGRDGNMEMLPSGTTRNSISNWININPTFLELQPNESGTIQINLQSSTEDISSKWGMLSFYSAVEQTAFSADRELQTGITISGRIDIYLSYTPISSSPPRVEINQLQEVDSEMENKKHFTVNIENLGDQITSGSVFLVANNLETAEEYRFETIEVITYPQSVRTVKLSMPNDLPQGRYALAALLDYPGSSSFKGTQIIIDIE